MFGYIKENMTHQLYDVDIHHYHTIGTIRKTNQNEEEEEENEKKKEKIK